MFGRRKNRQISPMLPDDQELEDRDEDQQRMTHSDEEEEEEHETGGNIVAADEESEEEDPSEVKHRLLSSIAKSSSSSKSSLFTRVPNPAFEFGERMLSSDSLIQSSHTEDDYLPIIPSLSTPQQQQRRAFRETLNNIQQKIKSHRAAKYLVEFEQELEEADPEKGLAIAVCSVDADVLNQQRDAMAQQELAEKIREERAHLIKLNHMETVEKRAQKYYSDLTKQMERETKETISRFSNQHKRYRKAVKKSFTDAKTKMKKAITKRKKGISDNFGKLGHSSFGYRSLLDWLKSSLRLKFAKQEVKIRVDLFRGLKDRLPKGQYVVFICLRDRIGGKMLGERPVLDEIMSAVFKKRNTVYNQHVFFEHDGKHNSLEVLFDAGTPDAPDQNIVTLTLPSKADRKPYLVYSFEIIKVDKKHAGICVGWGAFPVDNPHFGPVEGQFKLPVLRGWMDTEIDQYWKMHRAYSRDIDQWIGNLYFVVEVNKAKEIEYEGFDLLEEVHDQRLWDHDATQQEQTQPDMMSETRPIPAFEGFDLSSRGSVYSMKQYVSEEDLVDYNYELRQPEGLKEVKSSLNKGNFIAKAVITDMGLSRPFSLAFLIAFFLFAVAFWMRIYVHYFAQWLYLRGFMGLPGVLFEPDVVRVLVRYHSTALSLFHESAVIAAGVVLNYIILVFLIFSIWLFQHARINVPVFASKFVVAFGVMMIMDPLLIFVVDCCYKNFKEGDAFRLYHRFYRQYYQAYESGIWGILITLTIYAWTTVIGCFTTYFFFFTIFMNGQLIDVYKRLYGKVNSFFVPNDLEISHAELDYAIMKSLRYRGERGEIRKLIAMEYTLTDEYDAKFEEKTIHLILYSVSKTKEFRIYRQFLQYHDGTLIEVFNSEDALRVLNSKAANTISEQYILQQIDQEERKQQEIANEKRVTIQISRANSAVTSISSSNHRIPPLHLRDDTSTDDSNQEEDPIIQQPEEQVELEDNQFPL